MIETTRLRRQIMAGLLKTTILVISLLAVGTAAGAQQVQPTPEQMRMINQLPAAQREQALQALDQLNKQQGAATATQSQLSEELSQLPDSDATTTRNAQDSLFQSRAQPNSRVIVALTPHADLTPLQIKQLQDDAVLQRIQGSHHYELDESGDLKLPGLAPVPLLGLTAGAIEQRLGAEDSLKLFDIFVSILEIEPSGAQALLPFGYDVFQPKGSGFEPVTTGPVSPDYVLGPGDNVRIQFFGNVNRTDELEITRDGQLNVSDLGPISVAGQTFSEFRDDINRRVKEMLIGTQVSVSMGQLRTIRVFVMGDATRPGSYVVSSLATISSALYYSGGISEIGSLRNIQLKRQGRTVISLDLYDFLLNGDTSDDYRLQPGDVIFIPPVGSTVGVTGAVKRPAIYELRNERTVKDVIALSGGLLPDAVTDAARIERINDQKQRTIVSIAAENAGSLAAPVRAGDTLIIPKALQELRDSVQLVGEVQRAGPYQLRGDMRLTDLVPGPLYLKPGADTEYILIRREGNDARRVNVVSANLDAAWRNPESGENVTLQARDTVYVFSLEYGRQRVIEPILSELRLQARHGAPYRVVEISGNVKAPGEYPLEAGMRLSDLIRAGGDLSEAAYAVKAELTRYEIVNGEYRTAEIRQVDLDAVLRGDDSANFTLLPHDFLSISAVPDWHSEWTVNLKGEVKFPGDYRIRRGETLGQVLVRAGGLTGVAFAEGAIFLRESLREREQAQIDQLTRRLQDDLASQSLANGDGANTTTFASSQSILAQLKETKAVGRLVINLQGIVQAENSNKDSPNDIRLKDGDQLLVPSKSQVVTVIGEVQQSTSHLYQPGLARDDYLALSGGLTRRADKKLIYVVRANGAVIAGSRSRWFGRTREKEIRPGDTIVVPLQTDRLQPIKFWSDVTQILYQGAIAISAIKTFN